MTTAHAFMAASLDGFIARTDGDIDWLMKYDTGSEDHGYDAFIADKALILMGRGCYEKVLSFEAWPYELPVVVLSRQLAGTAVPERLRGKVSFLDLTPAAVMDAFAQQGIERIYLDGGRLIQSFIREGLLSDLVITRIPVLLGSGIALFGALPRDIDLELVSNRSFPSGFVQSTYRVLCRARAAGEGGAC